VALKKATVKKDIKSKGRDCDVRLMEKFLTATI